MGERAQSAPGCARPRREGRLVEPAPRVAPPPVPGYEDHSAAASSVRDGRIAVAIWLELVRGAGAPAPAAGPHGTAPVQIRDAAGRNYASTGTNSGCVVRR